IARLLLLHRAREHFPALTSAVSGPDQSPVWAVTVWVPAEEIPADATAQPNAEAEIAARFFLFDAETGTLLTDAFVSKEVLEIMGWIQQDSVDFSKSRLRIDRRRPVHTDRAFLYLPTPRRLRSWGPGAPMG